MTRKVIIITSIGIAIGAICGYLYYYFVGCASGSCAITSKPLNSTLYGSLLGGLLFNMFVKEEKKKKINTMV
jgi:hypothetical protein